MYNVEDILARLQSGECVDDIAGEMANALNEAVNQKAKLDEEAKLAAAIEAEKETRADAIVSQFTSFLHDYYPDCKDTEGLTGKDLIALVEEARNLAHKFDKVICTIDTALDSLKAAEKNPGVGKKSADDIISEFFKNNGIY